MSSTRLLFESTLLTSTVHAYSSASPNCALPATDRLPNFVSSPNVRGTLDIVWSCLATIIACTYTVLHLNIPEQRDVQDLKRSGTAKFRWWWKSMKPSVKWTLVNILAPEYYAGVAIQELIDAKSLLRELGSLPPEQHPARGWTLTYAFYINMGGFRIPIKDSANDWPSPIVLRGKTFVALLQAQERLPSETKDRLLGLDLPTTADIQDRSKSDRFAKAVTMLQVTYFCVSCFARLARHLPITLLELGTLGFAACSLVTYGVLFDKPRAVNSTTTLPDPRLHTCPSAAHLLRANGPLLRLPENEQTAHWTPSTWTPTLFLATVLGAIHTAGWSFAFPSAADKWLWRASSIASMGSPLLWMALAAPVLALTYTRAASSVLYVGVVAAAAETGALMCVYVLARLVLMALMVRGLLFLPAGAFVTTWTAEVPHLG